MVVNAGQRFGGGVGAVVGLILAAAIAMWVTRAEGSGTLEAEIVIAQDAEGASVSSNVLRRFAQDVYLNVHDTWKETEYEAKWHEQHDQLVAQLAEVDRYATNDSDHTAALKMRQILGDYDLGFARVTTKIHRGELTSWEACSAEMAVYEDEMQHLETVAADLATRHYAAAQVAAAAAGSQLNPLLALVVAVIAVAIVIGIGVGVLLFGAMSHRFRGLTSPSQRGTGSERPVRSSGTGRDKLTSTAAFSAPSSTSYLN